jgi:FKBP-type peptidyl-prolyl cis-trans isomerase FkpA
VRLHPGNRVAYGIPGCRFLAIPAVSGLFPLLVLCTAFICSCSDSPRQVQTTVHMRMTDDSLVNFNHGVVVAESQEIDDYIIRHHWNMNRSQTGLRWMIYKNGKGALARKGDIALVRYSVSRIGGDLIYRSDSLAPFEFETGKAKVPNGLEEAVMLMKPGDHAKLIVPSHLAFGLLGDMDKIIGRETLVYDIELYALKQRKN